jgi:hypothetical protein
LAAEIPHDVISLYSLRHTAASLLIGAAEHVRVIAERLGTSMKMFDDTYSHVPQKLQQAATDRMTKCCMATNDRPAFAHYPHTKAKGQLSDNAGAALNLLILSGEPSRTRTCDPLVR